MLRHALPCVQQRIIHLKNSDRVLFEVIWLVLLQFIDDSVFETLEVSVATCEHNVVVETMLHGIWTLSNALSNHLWDACLLDSNVTWIEQHFWDNISCVCHLNRLNV